MADDPHAAVMLALLRADPVLVVYDGAVSEPEPAKPYVVVYFHGLPSRGDDLTGLSTETKVRATVHCVGATAESSRIISQRVEAALLDQIPAITGRICWPIECEYNQPPIRDEYTGVVTQDLISVYVLKSKRV